MVGKESRRGKCPAAPHHEAFQYFIGGEKKSGVRNNTAAMDQPIYRVCWRDDLQSEEKGFVQCLGSPGDQLPPNGLALAPHLLDGIEVRRIGGRNSSRPRRIRCAGENGETATSFLNTL